jgi:translocation and assembly module TamB
MAIVADSQSRTLHSTKAQAADARSGRRVWRRRLIIALAGLLVLVALAPLILAHSPVATWIVNRASAKLDGQLSIGSLSLGWFSPIRVSDVALHDRQGNAVVEIPQIAGDRSLWAILCNSSRLGHFRIDQPKLHLVLHDKGSNLEDVLAAHLHAKEDSGGGSDVSLEIVDASVTIEDAQTRQKHQIDKLTVSVDAPADRAQPITVALSGVVPDPRQNGRFEIHLKKHRHGPAKADTNGPGAEGDELSIHAEALPLALVEAVARRAMPDLKLSGRLTTGPDGIVCHLEHQPAEAMVVQGSAMVERLTLSAAALGGDPIALAGVRVSGPKGSGTPAKIAWHGGQIDTEGLVLESDVASVAMVGGVSLGDSSAGGGLRPLVQRDCRFGARVDLARLAAMLPNTLRIREGTRITSGDLEVQWASGPSAQGRICQAEIKASNLTAQNAGRQLAWDQPILVVLNARDDPQGPVIDNLTCQSSFLAVDAHGTPEAMMATAKLDLGRLADEAGRFVDLGGLRLAGGGLLKWNWKRRPEGAFETTADVKLDNFQLAIPGHPAWTEASVTLAMSATGRAGAATVASLDSAAVVVQAGPERWEARLIEPVGDLGSSRAWPLRIRGQGNLGGWQARLGSWLALAGWQTSGAFDLSADLMFGSDAIGVRQSQLNVSELRIAGPGWDIREPRVELAAVGRWDTAARRLSMDVLNLSSSTVAAQMSSFLCTSPPQGSMQMAGHVGYEALLERIEQWKSPTAGASRQMAGRMAGRLEFNQDGPWSGERTSATANLRWDSAELYGFQVGPGNVQARLARGIVEFSPLDVSVSEGRARLAPRVQLAPEPAVLTLPHGIVLQHVRINPTVSARLLQYIAPALAGITSVDGRLTVELDNCRVPLANPTQADVTGRLTIHSAQLGGGPLVSELATLFGQTPLTQLAPESTIEFHMANGRVEHRGMQVVVAGVTIRTSGSVGIVDKTMALLAEMPVPAKWLTNTNLAPALRNQTLKLPITGTLGQPTLDRKSLAQASKQFLQNAAHGVIQDQIGQGLNRLFNPSRPQQP